MEKFSNLIEQKIAPVANKLASQKYLRAIQNTFLALIPLFTIGSFALVIISPPADYTTMDAGILRSLMQAWSSVATFTEPVLGYINMITMSLIALWISVGLSFNLSKHYKMEKSYVAIAVSVAAFMLVANMNSEGTLIYDYLDGKGIFPAIIVTIFAFELYRTLSEKKVGYINLGGAGVTPALAESLGNLVPIVIVFLVVGTLNAIIMKVIGVGIPQVIEIAMNPFVNMVDSIGGIIVLAVLVMLFWWFGIHDSVITGPLDTFLMNNYLANQAAFTAGTAAVALPYIVTEPFWWNFMTIGGSGATLGLAILALFSKSKQIKTVGKLSIVPVMFNINEPLIFGLPLMYNPTMMIPFICVMPLNGVMTYLAMSTGLVSKTFAYAGWNMFAPIAGLIDTMDIRGLILVCVMIVVDALIYLPFFKVYEKQKIKEEMAEEAAQA